MKYVNLLNLDDDQKRKATRVLGVRDKRPIVYAKLFANNCWQIYQNQDGSPLNNNKKRIKLTSISGLNDLIKYFQDNDLIPYCPLFSTNSEETITSFKKFNKTEIPSNRKYYRKKVQLSGTFINKRTECLGELWINDLSFQGILFTPIGLPDIRQGDMLTVEFHLDNFKQSKVKRMVKVKHITNKRMGGKFIKPPTMDSDLGFYLMG